MKPFHLVLLGLLLGRYCLDASGAVPNPSALHAWYQADASLQSDWGTVIGWRSSGPLPEGKTLDRVVGKPRLWRVQTKDGVKEVLRLDGESALWQAPMEWGSVPAPRTVLCFARIPSGTSGVLYDSATPSSATPAQLTPSSSVWHILRLNQTASRLSGFVLGANASFKNGVRCDIAEMLVFSRLLSPAEIEEHSKYLSQKWGTPTDLPKDEQYAESSAFAPKLLRKNGEEQVHTYRRPGLATTPSGTLLAIFEQRRTSGRELPSDIDIGLLRSTDNGDTWQPMQTILDFDASAPETKGNGVGSPCILVDREKRRIFVAALWSKGDRAWNGSGPGLDPEQTGQLVLVHSDDDGLTWSAPRNITPEIKQPAWRLCLPGPGCGIQLQDGTLVFPGQFRDADGMPRAFLLLSSDHGVHWKASPAAIPESAATSEAQAAELADGSVLFSMRDESRSGHRVWCRFDPKAEAWGKYWYELPDPSCQASLLAHSDGSLLFCNPAQSKHRATLTVRTSRNSGLTWSNGRVIDARPSQGSCLSTLKDGRIALLYEGETGLSFARIWPEDTNLAAVPVPRDEADGTSDWWIGQRAEKFEEAKRTPPDLLFLGDLHTLGWSSTGARIWQQHYGHRRAAHFGFDGDSTQHLLWRIQKGELDGLQPHLIVLQIGTHNLNNKQSSPEQIAVGIKAVVDSIAQKCPGSRVLLLGILPRQLRTSDALRQRVEEVNALLPPIADGKRVFFLNIGHAFLDAKGVLLPNISPDQFHLTTKGYALWAEAIESALQGLLEAAP